jgi:hypothetical protein
MSDNAPADNGIGRGFFLDKATELNRLLEIIAGLPAVDSAAPI